ncbi:hypothetical protein [Cyanobium sp. ATX-6F1]|uniref:hypothetical protein n=1 Tax=Cyanobium sp. ATX-6F1 TaxID=3137388 RepID=UPI0039BE870B
MSPTSKRRRRSPPAGSCSAKPTWNGGLSELGNRTPDDALATLTGFSAAVVAQELGHGPQPIELLVAGGAAAMAS